MTSPTPSSRTSAPSPVHALMLLMFLGSGCAALIYEVVWFQMLTLVIGSSTYSIGILLGTFMGGMCLGSLLLAKVISSHRHPLRIYAMLEVGIAICGLLMIVGLPAITQLYSAIAIPGKAGLIFRVIIAGLCLLPPTLLMGATLPAVARWVKATPSGISWLGFFYGCNIVGAVAGCLVAGFYLLRFYDVQRASYVAVALNLVVAAVAFLTAKATRYEPAKEEGSASLFSIPAGSGPVYLTIALSGTSALGSEVVWTRLLALLLGQTVYTFSLILATFLSGLAIGSTVGAMIARLTPDPRRALGICQFLILGSLGWAAFSLCQSLPYWPINPSLATGSMFQFHLDFARAAWVVLPGAILWGASFPLALASTVRPGDDTGRLVGSVYAANTVGAIFGAILTAMVFIPSFGTQVTQRVIIGVAVVAALVSLTAKFNAAGSLRRGRGAIALLIVAFGSWVGWTVIPVPALLIGYGHNAANRFRDHPTFLFWGEGVNSSMAVSEVGPGIRNYHNAGKVQASSEPQDMRLQRMLGHMTTLLPNNAGKKVLVIGCGAGVTAGAASIGPNVEELHIAEIEALVPKFVARHFGEHNYNVVDNPKTKIHIDDARHFLISTKEKFDAITSDPFDPWVKGAATLYTAEFWELAKKKLNPGGVITVFVQLYESGEPAVKSEIGTFLEVFPHGMVFSNTFDGAGYDTVMVGSVEPLTIDVDAMEAKLQSPKYAEVRQSLREIGFDSAVRLMATFAGRKAEFAGWLSDLQVNRDRNLRLQYLAGTAANYYDQGTIHRNMIKDRKYPEGVFTGSPATLQTLRGLIESGGF
ncbi:MAG: fused MFS/spermidine synthase [Opitutaceae bacterium]